MQGELDIPTLSLTLTAFNRRLLTGHPDAEGFQTAVPNVPPGCYTDAGESARAVWHNLETFSRRRLHSWSYADWVGPA